MERIDMDILDEIAYQKKLRKTVWWIYIPVALVAIVCWVLFCIRVFGFGSGLFWLVVMPLLLAIVLLGTRLFGALDEEQKELQRELRDKEGKTDWPIIPRYF